MTRDHRRTKALIYEKTVIAERKKHYLRKYCDRRITKSIDLRKSCDHRTTKVSISEKIVIIE